MDKDFNHFIEKQLDKEYSTLDESEIAEIQESSVLLSVIMTPFLSILAKIKKLDKETYKATLLALVIALSNNTDEALETVDELKNQIIRIDNDYIETSS